MNIMSFHGISKVMTSTVILACCSALVPYSFSKVFIIVENNYVGFVNKPDPIIKRIYASSLYDEDILFAHKAEITSIFKTLNKVVITTNVYNELSIVVIIKYMLNQLSNSFNFCQTRY